MDVLMVLHNQHEELSDLWKLYRMYCQQEPKDDQFWHDVAVGFSSKGMIRSDFGSELAQFFLHQLDKQFGGLRNENN